MEKRSGNAVTVGNFDGFHLGHQSIVRNTLSVSRDKQLGSLLLTFTPNPRLFFNAEDQLIFSDDQKRFFLRSSGIENIVNIDFSEVFRLDGREFIDKYLLEKYRMSCLVVGDNFGLGKGREWDINRIAAYGNEKGFEVRIVPSEFLNGVKISSSFIRGLLRNGEVALANKMMGRSYSVSGVIRRGNRVGTKLGFPTMNIIGRECLLPNGVYQSVVNLNGEYCRAATYIGENPTINRSERKIEAHVFGFRREVYDQVIDILFLNFIREEISFKSKEDLITQIEKDIKKIKFDFKNEL